MPGRRNKFIWIILVLFNSLMIFQSAKVEGALFHYLTWPSRAEKSEVLLYRNTGKQSVLFTQDTYSSGQVDQRLFLDGFLQWSTLGGIQSYHQGLTGIRSDLGSEPKKILILGGGEGIAANQLIAMAPQDYIQILDFDCQLLKMSSSHRELRVLAPKVWDSKNVQVKCADAFWFVSQKSQEEMWDLVLIDFPHGIGDAASSKVETLGFYSSVWNLLVPGGYISTHHENFGSDSQVCVKKNLELAGFETSDQGFQGMGFTYGKKISTSKRVIAYDASIIQSELRLPCWKIF